MFLAFVAILKGINPLRKLNHDIVLKNLGFFTYKKDFQKSPEYIFPVSDNNLYSGSCTQQQIFLIQRLLTFSVYYSVTDFATILSSTIFLILKKKKK